MAQRKNAKSSGNSSSSGSGSGSSSAGSSGGSSSPGARRETKHGGHKNGRKGGLSGTSFFTWFMVIALLGVWTSVAVVWFDLVDYEEVLGKLGIYDADGDGDFDVDDAKVLLGLKERSTSEPAVPREEAEPHTEPEEQVPVEAEPQNIEDEAKEQIQSLLHEMVHAEHVEGEDLQQEDGPTGEPQQEDDEFLMATDVDDRFETLEPEVSHEETEHSYHVEETDSSEPVVEDERLHHDTDNVTYQVYEEQAVYEPPENEEIEITEVTAPPEDNPVEDSQVIVEEVSIFPVEEQQEVPPDT
ncbi:aspartyl/asparaginyl beta-hydroxylase isoform X46 [Gorilla gorilla gorilla]|uniref:Aspartate beta-hydroxylase n=1 Tax=Gorilla gorilla gorilla TaxID=9595 RepID=A0A2I2YU66_GORGO